MILAGEEAAVRAGDCVVIPPGAEHQLVNDGDAAARAAVLLLAAVLARGHRAHSSFRSSGLTRAGHGEPPASGRGEA